MIEEPDVALTDWALAVEAAVLAALLARRRAPRRSTHGWWALFFAAVGSAALVGGSVHAFWAGRASPVGDALWVVTLLLVGLASLAAWGAGARLALAPAPARRTEAAGVAAFVAYAAAVLAGARAFAVAAAATLASALFLLAAFTVALRRGGGRPAWLGVLGVLTVFAASGVQWAAIPLHPRWFNHNALYHVIAAVALLMLFGAARGLGEPTEDRPR